MSGVELRTVFVVVTDMYAVDLPIYNSHQRKETRGAHSPRCHIPLGQRCTVTSIEDASPLSCALYARSFVSVSVVGLKRDNETLQSENQMLKGQVAEHANQQLVLQNKMQKILFCM